MVDLGYSSSRAPAAASITLFVNSKRENRESMKIWRLQVFSYNSCVNIIVWLVN